MNELSLPQQNNESLTFLKNVSIFSNTDEQGLREILLNTKKATYHKNTIIVTEGDEASSLYIILEGRVKVYLSDAHGKEVYINALFAGDYFGELSLIDEEPRSATIKTIEKSSFLILSKLVFEKILKKFPNINSNILKEMCTRIRVLSNNVRNLALLDVYGRVVKILYELSDSENGKLIIKQKLTQQDIADRIGSSREMVARILRELNVGGYIQQNKHSLIINKKLPDHF